MEDKKTSEYVQKINSRRKIKISNLDKKEICNLVSMLSESEELHFFDYFHPQWSDPGAYVTVLRYNNEYIYKIGNHGWSSDWHYIDIQRLIRYIFKNRDYQDDSFYIHEIINKIRLKDSEPSGEMFWEDKLNIIYTDNNGFLLYEVNGYHVIHINQTNESYAIVEDHEQKLDCGIEFIKSLYDEYSNNRIKYECRKVTIKRK